MSNEKSALIEDYIVQTFPYQIRDALEQQQDIVDLLKSSGSLPEELERQESILTTMLSSDFQDEVRRTMREGLDKLSEEQLKLACLYESTMKAMESISLDIAARFDAMLAEK